MSRPYWVVRFDDGDYLAGAEVLPTGIDMRGTQSRTRAVRFCSSRAAHQAAAVSRVAATKNTCAVHRVTARAK